MTEDRFDQEVEVFGRNWLPPDDHRPLSERLAEHPILIGVFFAAISAVVGAYCGWRFL